MATRKKKSDLVMSADLSETIDATGQDVVKIVKGNHLTVTTFPNGKVKLVWDDEALLRDVRAALLKAESVLPVTKNKSKGSAK
jgi:hypothetical protein